MDRLPGKNIFIKIFALILATILWLYVTNEQNPPIEASFQVPLEVRNLAPNFMVVDAPDSVPVKVRGPRSLVAGVRAQDIKSYLDLQGVTEGRHAVQVHSISPSSLELVESNPDKVMIRLDTGVSHQMPVEIKWTGVTATGTAVGKATANIEKVTVEGPRSLADTVDRVVAVPDITGKETDFITEVPLMALNREGKEIEGVTFYPKKVNISFTLVRASIKKAVDVKPALAGELPAGVTIKRISIEPDKIELSGEPQFLDKIEFVYTEPINVTDIDKDTDREVKLQLKNGIVASKNSVIVHISVDKIQT